MSYIPKEDDDDDTMLKDKLRKIYGFMTETDISNIKLVGDDNPQIIDDHNNYVLNDFEVGHPIIYNYDNTSNHQLDNTDEEYNTILLNSAVSDVDDVNGVNGYITDKNDSKYTISLYGNENNISNRHTIFNVEPANLSYDTTLHNILTYIRRTSKENFELIDKNLILGKISSKNNIVKLPHDIVKCNVRSYVGKEIPPQLKSFDDILEKFTFYCEHDNTGGRKPKKSTTRKRNRKPKHTKKSRKPRRKSNRRR